MASKHFEGTLVEPIGDAASNDKLRFTHTSTTGQTIGGAQSVVKIDLNGDYSFDLEYGIIQVEYYSETANKWRIAGSVIVNSDTTVTTITGLLNAMTPTTPAIVLELQQILAEAEQAALESQQSASEAEQSAIESAASAVLSAENAAENGEVIKSLLVAQGLSGNVGFFAGGFTYGVVGDVGIDVDGKIYIYAGSDPLPVTISAGTNPVGDSNYEQIFLNNHQSLINRNVGGAHKATSIDLDYGTVDNAIKVLTPQMFGGDPSGGDDDTAALQSCLNIDRAVYIPAGKWGVDGGLIWDFNALRMTGDGISSWIEGANGHTITVNAGQADGVIEHLWIDQVDTVTGLYDAIHLKAGEMHINFVDVDFSDRYGIYVGSYRTQVSQYASQACLGGSIYVHPNAYGFTATDVLFENAGLGVPNFGIQQNGQRGVIKGVSAFNIGNYVWDLVGSYNSAGIASATYSSTTGGAGTYGEDAYRVTGSFNAHFSAIARGTVGVAHNIIGNSNAAGDLVSDNSTKQGLKVSGTNNSISGGRINSAGTDNVSESVLIEGDGTTLNINAAAPTNAVNNTLTVNSNENCVTGRYVGHVYVDGGDSNYSIKCGSLILNSGNSNAVQAAITGNTASAACRVVSNSHALAITVNNADVNIAEISGSSNIGYVRGFGASGAGIIVSGNDNELQLRASGSVDEDIIVSGNWNNLSINAAGDVEISGDQNCITGVIKGNLIFTATANKNIVFGKVLGTITDLAADNDVSNVTS